MAIKNYWAAIHYDDLHGCVAQNRTNTEQYRRFFENYWRWTRCI